MSIAAAAARARAAATAAAAAPAAGAVPRFRLGATFGGVAERVVALAAHDKGGVLVAHVATQADAKRLATVLKAAKVVCWAIHGGSSGEAVRSAGAAHFAPK